MLNQKSQLEVGIIVIYKIEQIREQKRNIERSMRNIEREKKRLETEEKKMKAEIKKMVLNNQQVI